MRKSRSAASRTVESTTPRIVLRNRRDLRVLEGNAHVTDRAAPAAQDVDGSRRARNELVAAGSPAEDAGLVIHDEQRTRRRLDLLLL